LYLEKLAIAMFNQNIKGASYVEDIAYQLDSLGTDYIRIVEQRDAAIRELDELKLRVGILEYIHDDPLRHREQCSEAVSAYCREAKKEHEQHAETKKQLNTLLESQSWGVNCKPSAPDWLTKEDRETLLRLSYSLDYVQSVFIRSLLARLTPPEVRE
jgi:hypothetical protein